MRVNVTRAVPPCQNELTSSAASSSLGPVNGAPTLNDYSSTASITARSFTVAPCTIDVDSTHKEQHMMDAILIDQPSCCCGIGLS